MSLNTYAAEKRRAIFEALKQGSPPPEGEFSDTTLREGRAKGVPQMGATRFEAAAITFEFIYPDQRGAATVLAVRLPAPERIVFMPVPDWVIDSVWQGEVDGSYQFESDARRLLADFEGQLEPERNISYFGPRQAKRRE